MNVVFIIAKPPPICKPSGRFLSLDKAKTDCYNRISLGKNGIYTERHGLYNEKSITDVHTPQPAEQ